MKLTITLEYVDLKSEISEVSAQKKIKTPIKAKTVIFYFKPDTNEN